MYILGSLKNRIPGSPTQQAVASTTCGQPTDVTLLAKTMKRGIVPAIYTDTCIK